MQRNQRLQQNQSPTPPTPALVEVPVEPRKITAPVEPKAPTPPTPVVVEVPGEPTNQRYLNRANGSNTTNYGHS